jgi:hypothetical protein
MGIIHIFPKINETFGYSLHTYLYMKYNLIGKTFTHLTVVGLAPRESWKGNTRYWICHCDCCGKEKTIRTSHLTLGKTTSCGCLRLRRAKTHPNWTGHEDISGDFFYSLVAHAKARKIPVTVTIKQIWELFVKQNKKCALSGEDITFQSSSRSRDGTASLDRIDSTGGYTIDNVWWVHKDINTMKWDLGLERFKHLCKRVSEIAEIEYLKTLPV